MAFLSRNSTIQRVIIVTQEQINTPTSSMLSDYTAIFQLGAAPYTRYQSDGDSLLAVTQNEATILALIDDAGLVSSSTFNASSASLQTQINAISALIGSSVSPSKPTATSNPAFAGALAPGVSQAITPAKWSGTSVTVTSASPAVVTWNSHGLVTGSEIIFNGTAVPTGVTAGSVYYVSATDLTANTFKFSATNGGALVNTSSTGTSVTIDNVVPSSRVWHVFINGSIDATPNRMTPEFTPAFGHAGFAAWVTEEATARNGSGQVQATSVPVIVSAPAVFSATVAQGTISGTEGQAITSVAPVIFAGGTGAVTITISPSLSGTGFSINSSTGVISGTRTQGLGALTGTYTVTGTDSVPTAVSANFTFNIAASGVQPLAALALPAATNITGYSGSYDGSNSIIVSGTVRVGPVSDPAGSGTTVDLHRIVQSGSTIQRAEVLHLSPSYVPLICQHEYWFAFAVRRLEAQPTATPDTECLVWQVHTSQSGATQPVIALYDNGQGDMMRWRVSGCSHDPGGGLTHDPGDAGYTNPWVTDAETRPAVGVWWRYVGKFKPGWTGGHDKIVKIWRGKPGEAMTNITTGGVYTGVNDYNDGNSGLTAPSYPRKGLYKYGGVNWSASIVSYYISRLYLEENSLGVSEATMLARATESVAWCA